MKMVDAVTMDKGGDAAMAEQLELGNVLYFPQAPFALPHGEDLQAILRLELAGRLHKNVSYDPSTAKISGIGRCTMQRRERIVRIFARFSAAVTHWLGEALPNYRPGWKLDRVSYRPVEESARKLRRTARNDLVHVDAFPNRPSRGARILRVFANVNPSEERVWLVSEPFDELLKKHGERVGLPKGEGDWTQKLWKLVGCALRPKRAPRTAYDRFMLRMHHYVKRNEAFQKHCPKRYLHFAPGSVWMAMTDTASHAVVRGRCALEHSYFVAAESLVLPERSPLRLLERACGKAVLPPKCRAA